MKTVKRMRIFMLFSILLLFTSCFNTNRSSIEEVETIEAKPVSELDGAREDEQYYIDGLQFVNYLKEENGEFYHAIYDNDGRAIIPFKRRIISFDEYHAYLNGVRKRFYLGRSLEFGDELYDAKFNTIICRRKSLDLSIVTEQTFSFVHTICEDDYEGAVGMDGRVILDVDSKRFQLVDLKNDLDDRHIYFETWNDGMFELYDLDGRFILEAEDYWVCSDDSCIYYGDKDNTNRRMRISEMIREYNLGY